MIKILNMKIQLPLLLLAMNLCLFQKGKSVFYIVDKEVYIKLERNEKKRKVSFSEDHDFYFSVKNDSVALIQEVRMGKKGRIEEYQISTKYDTTYVKHYIIENGKKKVNEIEQLIYRRIFKK